MDDTILTSQAIAELLRGRTGQGSRAACEPQERKINPLGKPNKRFLGRTINNVLRHNERQTERTQLSCQQKLKELDDKKERRKRNVFYSRNSREDLYVRNGHKRSSKNKSKNRDSSKDSARSNRSSSREPYSRSRGYKKKHKKARKKQKKRNKRRRGRSTSSEEDSQPRRTTELSRPRNEYYNHSNNLALAVSIAYSQRMSAKQKQASEPPSPASTSSDIIRELMSDSSSFSSEKDKQDLPSDTLSIGSLSDGMHEIVTIDVSSPDEQSVDTDFTTESEDGSCIALEECYNNKLKSDNDSDIEIIECEPEQLKDKIKRTLSTEQIKVDDDCSSVNMRTTFDLTDD